MCIDIGDGSGHFIFDTCIKDYNSYICLSQSLENKFVEYVKICFFAFFAFLIWMIKRKMTRKNVD